MPREEVYYANVLSDYLDADTEGHELRRDSLFNHLTEAQHSRALRSAISGKHQTHDVTRGSTIRVYDMKEILRHLALHRI